MRVKRIILCALLSAALLVCAAGAPAGFAAPAEETSQSGGAVRIGYMESENYDAFTLQTFYAAKTLMSLGILSEFSIDEATDSRALWNAVCKHQTGGSAEFVKSAYYVYDRMDAAALDALIKTDDIDVLFVMGTAAGKWLTANADAIGFDYMVYASASPVSAGIVASETERLNSRSFAHVDPNRMGRQVDMAYRIFGFTDIGVVYADNDAAYSYSGIPQLMDCSEKYGFTVHTVHVEEPVDDSDYDRYYRELKAAYAELTPQIQALYITTGMIEDEKLPWLLEEVHAAGIYTVTETSESQVEKGVLLHLTLTDSAEEGDFAGRTLAEYIGGTPITELDMVFEFTPKIVINYDTARLVGAQIPMKVLLIADTIYPLSN